MGQFRVNPQIFIYDRFAEFAEAFKIGKGDLVITNEFIYSSGLAALSAECAILFQERYGSGEPSDLMMDQIFCEARRQEFNRVIAIGGGTVIDVAKLLVLAGTGRTVDYFERRIPLTKAKELIIIPTTCGTGSEMTNITIMEIKEQNTKKGLAADELYADYAVMVPELLSTLPYQVFATSSVDALIHAMESYVAPNSNEFTEVFSTKAIRSIVSGYKKITASGKEERSSLIKDFLLASAYAGIAFANTGVGAVHALSYPLGSVYHVPHGEANLQLFTAVFTEYKKGKPAGKIQKLEQQLAEVLGVAEAAVWLELDKVLQAILSRKPLREYGMQENDIEAFADNVLANQQRLLKNNYVPLSRATMIEIYKNLF